MIKKDTVIVVRGGGDLATGTIHRLYQCGWRVLILECAKPTAIRRKAAFCEAVYEEQMVVEGVCCRRVDTLKDAEALWLAGEIPLLVDETAACVQRLHPSVVVDAILAKRNLGTRMDMAPLTIGLGPGFEAGCDVHYVIETMRGHNLGRIISSGCAQPNTGIPGEVAGYGKERVIHAPASGKLCAKTEIGDLVIRGQTLATIGDTLVTATLSGVLRGMIRDGFYVKKGLKIADIDPREDQQENCSTISDKARCIAGSVLEIIVSKGF